jgi:hypothetical protein
MAWAGMQWLIAMALLTILTVIGGMILQTIYNVSISTLKSIGIVSPPLSLDTIAWILPAYYGVILIFAIVISVIIYQQTITTVEYENLG